MRPEPDTASPSSPAVPNADAGSGGNLPVGDDGAGVAPAAAFSIDAALALPTAPARPRGAACLPPPLALPPLALPLPWRLSVPDDVRCSCLLSSSPARPLLDVVTPWRASWRS